MAQFSAPMKGTALSEFQRQSRTAPSYTITAAADLALQFAQVADFIFSAPKGSVITLAGIDGETLRELVDQAELIPDDRRALFVRLHRAESVESYVEQVIAAFAEAAIRLWPVWFTDVSFAMCRDDALGRRAAETITRQAAARAPGVRTAWAEEATRLALAGHLPRVGGTLPAVELVQLSSCINRAGLILVADLSSVAETSHAAALTQALEWVAQTSCAAVVALFTELPPLDSPFDRILYGARRVTSDHKTITTSPQGAEGIAPVPWLAPWRGTPHPLSEIEQRLSAMLREDPELASLFCFNWFVGTVLGSRPKVDLVWIEGRLVVELDGYPDHTTRRAFIDDRHRDYELALSGYTVLRLANDEITQDFGRAIEKMRDLVRLRRSTMIQEK